MRVRILVRVNAAPEFRSRSRVVPAVCRGMEIEITVTTGIKVTTKRKRKRGRRERESREKRSRAHVANLRAVVCKRGYFRVRVTGRRIRTGRQPLPASDSDAFHLHAGNASPKPWKRQEKTTESWRNKRRVMITPTTRRCHRDRLFRE